MDQDDIPDVDIPNLELMAEYELSEAATCMSLSSDKSLLALGSIDDAIVVLGRSLKLLHTLSGHEGGTNSLLFAGPAKMVSAGEDGRLCVWSATEDTLLHRVRCNGLDVDK